MLYEGRDCGGQSRGGTDLLMTVIRITPPSSGQGELRAAPHDGTLDARLRLRRDNAAIRGERLRRLGQGVRYAMPRRCARGRGRFVRRIRRRKKVFPERLGVSQQPSSLPAQQLCLDGITANYEG